MALLFRKTLTAMVAVVLAACGGSATPAPDLVGKRLDIAMSDLEQAGVEAQDVEQVGGGAFGALDESNWTVCDQEPRAGGDLTDNVRLLIDRTCGPEDSFDASPGAVEESESPSAALAPAAEESLSGPPPHEISVDRCEIVGTEVIASGTIKNLDSEPQAFVVNVEFFDQGGAKIEEGNDLLPIVEPGQTARWQQDNFTRAGFTLGDCKATVLGG